MTISENIRSITEDLSHWQLFRNRSYPVQIQLADPSQVYNVPGRPGVIYNFLEDAYEPVTAAGCVLTGLLGEMWVIPPEALAKYAVDPAALTHTPQPVETRETDARYLGVRIPAGTEFTLEADYGVRVTLHGNRAGIPHGAGDMILTFAKRKGGICVPDPEDAGRIVNGSIFDRLYQPADI